MARVPSPRKAHRPKDLCTIEQAEQVAMITVKNSFAQMYALERKAERILAKRNVWWRRVLRWAGRLP